MKHWKSIEWDDIGNTIILKQLALGHKLILNYAKDKKNQVTRARYINYVAIGFLSFWLLHIKDKDLFSSPSFYSRCQGTLFQSHRCIN